MLTAERASSLIVVHNASTQLRRGSWKKQANSMPGGCIRKSRRSDQISAVKSVFVALVTSARRPPMERNGTQSPGTGHRAPGAIPGVFAASWHHRGAVR
jgi:hypothetical protein